MSTGRRQTNGRRSPDKDGTWHDDAPGWPAVKQTVLTDARPHTSPRKLISVVSERPGKHRLLTDLIVELDQTGRRRRVVMVSVAGFFVLLTA